MSKIIIDAREYSSSTGRYISRLIQYLELSTQTNSEHEFVILLAPKDFDAYTPSNPRFTKVICPHKEFTFDEQFGLLGQIKDLHPDLVHFGATQQPIGYRGLVVTTMHDLTTARFKNPSKNSVIFAVKQIIYKAVIKYVARKSVAIIAPSKYVQHDVAEYASVTEAKISVTYEAADAVTDSPEPLKALVSKRFIMYVGRPTPHKNLQRLIDAFVVLRQKQPDLQLVLAGRTDFLYERHYSYVQKQGIEGVVFTGFVSEGQLRWLYENCQAYIFPSLSEGFGLPGLEAMRHGAPVISSNATCLPEIYGSAARYFDPLSVDDMVQVIDDVIASELNRNQLRKNGFIRVENFSWQRMAKQTLAVYETVLATAHQK